MARTLVALAAILAACLLAPSVLAQRGPPPGYHDPVLYAQDEAKEQSASAQANPVGYVQSRNATEEAEHAAWFSCWVAYETAGHALDAVCAPFFTAPVTVEPAARAHAEISDVLNETGASAFADEALDALNDTVANPATVLDQVLRIAGAAAGFVQGVLDVVVGAARNVLGALGFGALAFGAGAAEAVKGVQSLAELPLDGLVMASNGIARSAQAASGLLGDVAQSGLRAIQLGAQDAADAVASAASSAVGGTKDAGRGLTSGLGHVVEGVQDAVHAAGDYVKSAVKDLFGGDEPTTSDQQKKGPLSTPDVGEVEGFVGRLLERL